MDILIAIALLGSLSLGFGLVLAFASKIFYVKTDPRLAFQLLPKKFTVRQLQNLLEAVYGVEIDNRNFRKKLFSSGILVETGEMEKNVNHKPAKLYSVNKSAFGKKKFDVVKIFTF